MINDLGSYGIYTMIDAHQDAMARMNCGEGIPDFYAQKVAQNSQCTGNWSSPMYDSVNEIFGECRSIDSYNYTKDSSGWPLISECNKTPFFKYYTTSEGLAISDALYTNKQNLTDSFVAFWDVLAKKFSNNSYVIGFDPINEPFPAGFDVNY